MSRGRPLTWGALGIVAAVAGLLSVLVWVIATGGGALVPAPPWVALLILLALAGGVLVVARPVRAYLKGTSRKPLDRLRAARVLVLGQAGALTGAVVGGWDLAASRSGKLRMTPATTSPTTTPRTAPPRTEPALERLRTARTDPPRLARLAEALTAGFGKRMRGR